MNDSRNFAIGILSTTATILFVGLMIVLSRPDTAQAGATTTTNGDYVLTVGVLTQNDQEIVYVVDAPAEKMIGYTFDGSRQQINVLQAFDLSEMRKSAEASSQPQQQNRRGNRRP